MDVAVYDVPDEVVSDFLITFDDAAKLGIKSRLNAIDSIKRFLADKKMTAVFVLMTELKKTGIFKSDKYNIFNDYKSAEDFQQHHILDDKCRQSVENFIIDLEKETDNYISELKETVKELLEENNILNKIILSENRTYRRPDISKFFKRFKTETPLWSRVVLNESLNAGTIDKSEKNFRLCSEFIMRQQLLWFCNNTKETDMFID